MEVARIFEVERINSTIVLNLRRGVEEIQFDSPPPDVERLLTMLRRGPANVIVDCHEVDFLRSTALGFFVTLWQRVRSKGGHMAFCNISEKARKVLASTKLDQVWTICDTRDDALQAVEM